MNQPKPTTPQAAAVQLANDVQAALGGIMTKAELARAVGMAPANLNRVLTGDGKPRNATVRALLNGITQVLGTYREVLTTEAHDDLQRRLDALSSGPVITQAPAVLLIGPGGPLPVSSELYVHRLSDDEVAKKLEAGQSFEIVGPPASGRSSAWARAAQLAREQGGDVLTIDLAPVASGASSAEAPTVDQALRQMLESVVAHAFPQGDAPETLRPADGASTTQLQSKLAAAFQAWCAAERPGRPTFFLDGLNLLPRVTGHAVESILRTRAQGDKDSAALVYVLCASSPVDSALAKQATVYASTGDTAVVETRWFSGPSDHDGDATDRARSREFLASDIGHLVECYAQGLSAPRRQRVLDIAQEAWALFRGQPRLTHQYLHDHALKDTTVEQRVSRVWDVSSPYRSHLRLLEVFAPAPLFGEEVTARSFEVVSPHAAPPLPFVPADLPPATYASDDARLLKELRLIEGVDTPWQTEYRWTSWYYGAHLAPSHQD